MWLSTFWSFRPSSSPSNISPVVAALCWYPPWYCTPRLWNSWPFPHTEPPVVIAVFGVDIDGGLFPILVPVSILISSDPILVLVMDSSGVYVTHGFYWVTHPFLVLLASSLGVRYPLHDKLLPIFLVFFLSCLPVVGVARRPGWRLIGHWCCSRSQLAYALFPVPSASWLDQSPCPSVI